MMQHLQDQLNDFNPQVRGAALAALLDGAGRGDVPIAPEVPAVNLHCHTFFSFNAYGHSPTSLAWLALREGYQALGIVDFDVLDAVDEFLAASELAGVRGTAGIETRIYLPEYATRELNSPGEPGVSYHMGIGFTCTPVPPAVQGILADLRERARGRNLGVMRRVNSYLDPVGIEYERDVLPLTPAGNATERHMLVAYMRAAQSTVEDPARFWAGKLNMDLSQIQPIVNDAPRLQNLMRARLMKRGGVGYVQPGPDSFPSLEEFQRLVVACGALPCMAWLDGTTTGEEDARQWVEFWLAKGALTLNIVPDRNWNIADPAHRRVKVQKLYEIVALAEEYDLPLNVGTEMNTFGNKLVDDFEAPELAPVRQAFLDGAHFVYGHTVLQRTLGLGYLSAWAEANLPTRQARNSFYTRAGYLVKPGPSGLASLQSLRPNLLPEDVLAGLAT
jgi:hypothetical protein